MAPEAWVALPVAAIIQIKENCLELAGLQLRNAYVAALPGWQRVNKTTHDRMYYFRIR